MTAKGRITASLLALGVLLLAGACASGSGASPLPSRPFPEVKVPSLLSQEEMADYVLDHFWDAYLDTTGRYLCDSTHVGGVDERMLATQLASFLSILENYPAEKAQPVMEAFFGQLERYQASDTASNVFPWVTEAVDYYLYDPNSEIRSEELYLPFVSRLAASPLTREEQRARYAHAAEVCSTHRIGTPAADFRFVDGAGRQHTLYAEKAPLTILIFVNPGCQACGDAVAAFEGDGIKALVRDGKLKILGIYIDEEVDAWKEQAGHLPAHWINGYDPDGLIRSDRIYYVRAIPSVYLLDADKRILMKDAVPQSVAAYVENLEF